MSSITFATTRADSHGALVYHLFGYVYSVYSRLRAVRFVCIGKAPAVRVCLSFSICLRRRLGSSEFAALRLRFRRRGVLGLYPIRLLLTMLRSPRVTSGLRFGFCSNSSVSSSQKYWLSRGWFGAYTARMQRVLSDCHGISVYRSPFDEGMVCCVFGPYR